jgi:hypothetical protein
VADFTMYRGDTVTINAAITASGLAYNLTGKSMWFTAKTSYSQADPGVFQKKLGSGISIVDATNGRAQIVIAASDTNSLGNSKTALVYDFQVKDSSGRIYTVASGKLIVIPDVTRSTS